MNASVTVATRPCRDGAPFRRGPQRRGQRLPAAVCLAIAATMAVGCSRGGFKQHPTHPVAGRADFGGKPPVGAHLVFHPQPEKPDWGDLPSAVVKPDGSFSVSTYRDGDGAPAGEYVVTAQWFPVGQDGSVGVNALDRSFATPASSPLRVTVQAGGNELAPLQLSAKPAPAAR